MIKFCLDTDVIIEYLRGDNIIVEKVKKILDESFPYITTITLCELFLGAYLTKHPETEIKKIETIINNSFIVTLDKNSSKIFGAKNKELLDKGRSAEASDLMISSICIINNLTLVTRNKKHFENISELKAEFW